MVPLPTLVALMVAGATGRAAVEDVAGGRVYVDVGTTDGLAVGDEIRVGSGRKSWLSCTVDHASDHHASCALDGARRGAPVRFERAPRAAPEPKPAPPAPPPDVARARRALQGAEFSEVEAQASLAGPVALRPLAEASITAEVWNVTPGDRDPFQRQQVEVRIRDVPLGFLGTTAQVEATVFGWAIRPDDARFRPGGSAQLYVHEISLESRDPQRNFTASAGRIRPWGAPGLLYLDGIQFGVRPRGKGWEVGVLAGTVPDLLALEPTTERWTGGVYGRTQSRFGRRTRLLTESRASVLSIPDSDPIFEAETNAIFETGGWLRSSAGARLAVDPDATRLASARAAAFIQPTKPLEIDLVFRTRDDRMDPLAPSFTVVGADHGYAAARYTIVRGLVLGAQGGVGHLRLVDETRGWVGPTLDLPRLFGRTGGMSFGHQEALGWLDGRSSFAQALLYPVGSLRILTRVSYLEDRVETDVGRQVAAYLNTGWRISRHFRLNAGGYVSWIVTGSTADAAPFGVVGRLTLTARL